jgi:hypothetical protein
MEDCDGEADHRNEYDYQDRQPLVRQQASQWSRGTIGH